MDADIKEQFENVNSKIDSIDSKFDSLNSRFDNLKDFLMEHFVTKQEFEDKLSEMPTKQDFQSLVSTVDGYAKQVNDTNQEILILGDKANRLESWAKQAATKIGVEYNV
jgi:chromosome segregation ATPase